MYYNMVLFSHENYDTLQRRSMLCITRNETAQPRSPFRDSCISEQFMYRRTDRANILIAHRYTNVGIGNVVAQFHFWEHLLRSFGTGSSQCSRDYFFNKNKVTGFPFCCRSERLPWGRRGGATLPHPCAGHHDSVHRLRNRWVKIYGLGEQKPPPPSIVQ
jgi:hypothetical protein